ncbi:MAG TPA: ABC transporter ATP-binding protein [Acidimicrobiales bacterium]|nr:ABC transporter ATP-binding protein [Acidimicrobiales bacterium]
MRSEVVTIERGGTTRGAPAKDRTGVRVELVECVQRYGDVAALDRFSLAIEPGELVALLGPSGCGKTTALRVLAGLEQIDAGTVRIGGSDVTAVPPNRREIGMVFQAYSLFPNMSALDNVAFGLRLRKLDAVARRRRAGDLLELVGLSAQSGRFPHELSGGQQQRVALARALAVEPRVLLLDEPLSALDAKVRAQLRDEIRRVQLEMGITTLFVTHDQEEALSMADRVGVMASGRLQQLGSPDEVYERPVNAFVAEFVGSVSRVPATVGAGGWVEVLGGRVPLPASQSAFAPGTSVDVLIRPESLSVAPDPLGFAHVVRRSFLGPVMHVVVAMPGRFELLATLPSSSAAEIVVGSAVRVEASGAPLFVTAPRETGA